MSMMQFHGFPGFSGFRAGSKNGGEYHGKCPANGPACVCTEDNTDRMRIWPHQGPVGMFSCRKCGHNGDAIQWLKDFQGMGYLEACAYLGIEPKSKTSASLPGRSKASIPAPEQIRQLTIHPTASLPGRSKASIPAPEQIRQLTIHPTASPSQVWIEHAEKFVAWCHDQLLANPAQLAYLAARGISKAAAISCRLGWNPADTYRQRESWGLPTDLRKKTGQPRRLWLPAGLVIPVYCSGILQRVRIRRPASERAKMCESLKYYRIPGSSITTMILGESSLAFAVVEAELDACAIFSAAQDLVGSVSIETLEGNLDAEASAILAQALVILNALDADDPTTPALQRALKKWSATFPRHLRWPVPVGKDPGEAVKAGVDLRTWILAGLPPVFTVGSGPAELSGQSSFSGLYGGTAEIEGDDGAAADANEGEKPEMSAPVKNGGDQDDVAELAGLLAIHPVRVLKSRDNHEIRIQWTAAWRDANRATASRISGLVFQSAPAMLAIHHHPATVIHGGNFTQKAKRSNPWNRLSQN